LVKVLKDSKYLTQKEFDSIYKDCEELIRMLTKSIKTLKESKK